MGDQQPRKAGFGQTAAQLADAAEVVHPVMYITLGRESGALRGQGSVFSKHHRALALANV
jgi:hypothetical protein